MIASIGRLNKTQIHSSGVLTQGHIFNITALRSQFTYRKIGNRMESQNSLPQQHRDIETHTKYANISLHTSQYQDQALGPTLLLTQTSRPAPQLVGRPSASAASTYSSLSKKL